MKNYFRFKKTNEQTGEGKYVCDHPLVEKADASASLSMDGSGFQMCTHLTFKDGTEKTFENETKDYSLVNEFLNNLPE